MRSGARKWFLSTKVPLRNDRNEVFGLVGISRDITERKLADVLRDGQAQILEMIAMSAPLEDVLDHLMHLVESQLTGIFGSVLLLDDDGDPPAARRRAEPGGGLYEGDRRRSHRPQGRLVRHGRLSAGSRSSSPTSCSDPLWEDYRELGARAWLSLMLVDADPVASRRGARHFRDVFEDSARADRGRNASDRGRRRGLPASRSSASRPKTASISWPIMTR